MEQREMGFSCDVSPGASYPERDRPRTRSGESEPDYVQSFGLTKMREKSGRTRCADPIHN